MYIEKSDLIACKVDGKLVFATVSSVDKDSVTLSDKTVVPENNIVGQVIELSKIKAFLTILKQTEYNKIFRVDFIKRTDCSYRMMVCKFGVTKALQGGIKKFNDSDHELKTVYDMQKEGYRSISLENILLMGFDGKRYVAKENMDLLASVIDQIK